MTATALTHSQHLPSARAIGFWLLCVAALVCAMIILGGATRLTQSGLSMVNWQPLSGILPPLTETAWQQEFDQYKQYPEYQKRNQGMSLDAFKQIFWFEYSHRVLGRLIGLAFAIPFLWFLARGQLRGIRALQLAGIFVLGGIQGLIGWWMVKSGLVGHPDVSQYRLAVHLALALALLALLLWFAWSYLSSSAAQGSESGPRGLAWFALVLTYLQALSGALVAGLDAGRHYNTFPTMNGAWMPGETWMLSPVWLNFFENPTTVQFDHRLGAYLVAAVVVLLWWRGRRSASDRQTQQALDYMLAALAIQFTLGVAALLYMVPASLGILHQTGALLLFTSVLYLAFRMRTTVPGRTAA